ncbi:hypothetical protein OE88DRAFT_1736523 [Heliocybe sulcata]|uniref:Uncharacterized protein n=1 Tax=Heliocybe sulcata TaxID=5364 RepID=A0A5C3MWE7_9AGAM|nr:hypothetical protein OE88DRAFT_1736523 [Heliocybe sulcata]
MDDPDPELEGSRVTIMRAQPMPHASQPSTSVPSSTGYTEPYLISQSPLHLSPGPSRTPLPHSNTRIPLAASSAHAPDTSIAGASPRFLPSTHAPCAGLATFAPSRYLVVMLSFFRKDVQVLFNSLGMGEAWTACVAEYERFEEISPFFLHTEDGYERYRLWWGGLNRNREVGSEISGDVNLASISVPGYNGIILCLVALSWWAARLTYLPPPSTQDPVPPAAEDTQEYGKAYEEALRESSLSSRTGRQEVCDLLRFHVQDLHRVLTALCCAGPAPRLVEFIGQQTPRLMPGQHAPAGRKRAGDAPEGKGKRRK